MGGIASYGRYRYFVLKHNTQNCKVYFASLYANAYDITSHLSMHVCPSLTIMLSVMRLIYKQYWHSRIGQWLLFRIKIVEALARHITEHSAATTHHSTTRHMKAQGLAYSQKAKCIHCMQ